MKQKRGIFLIKVKDKIRGYKRKIKGKSTLNKILRLQEGVEALNGKNCWQVELALRKLKSPTVKASPSKSFSIHEIIRIK